MKTVKITLRETEKGYQVIRFSNTAQLSVGMLVDRERLECWAGMARVQFDVLPPESKGDNDALVGAGDLEMITAETEFDGESGGGVLEAAPIATIPDWQLASAVKWAIESATGICCAFVGSELRAEATNGTVKKLAGIADTISGGFNALWTQFATFPTVTPADRGLFLRGLYDGMMNEQKPPGERLPARISQPTRKRATRKAVGFAAGVMVHPYNVAVELGKSIRFNVPLPEVINQLNTHKPKEITQ